jgi:hypothetical protein
VSGGIVEKRPRQGMGSPSTRPTSARQTDAGGPESQTAPRAYGPPAWTGTNHPHLCTTGANVTLYRFP